MTVTNIFNLFCLYKMDNIGLMEINEIRPFFTKAFYEIHTLDQTRETMDPDRPLDLGYRGYDDDTYGSSMPETTRFNNSQSSRMSTS